MSKQKKLHSQLRNIFADLEQDEGLLPASNARPNQGWSWACDANGRYLDCSPEVNDILGIPPQEFIGKRITRFALPAESAERVEAILQSRQFPAEIRVQYRSREGQDVPVMLCIFQGMAATGDGTEGGWRGFTQVLASPQAAMPPLGTQPKGEPPAPDLLAPPGPRKSTERPTVPLASAVPRPKTASPLAPLTVGDEQALTPVGRASLEQFQPLAQPASTDSLAVIAVPFQVQEQLAGVVEVLDDRQERTWTPDDQLLVEQVTGQLSLALENARLFQQTQTLYQETERRAEELAILNEMGRALSASLKLEDIFENVYRYTKRLIQTANFYVALYEPENDRITFPLFVEEGEHIQVPSRQFGEGYTEHIVFSRQPLLIRDTADYQSGQSLGLKPVVQGTMAQSYLGVPMLVGAQTLGIIAVQDLHRTQAFDDRDRDLLTAVASQAAIAIQNARLYKEEQQRRQIADTLREVARLVGSTLDLGQVIERMLEQLPKLVDFTTASIYLIRENQRRLIGRRTNEGMVPLEGDLADWHSISNDPLIVEMLRTFQPVVVADTQTEPRWALRGKSAEIRSWVAAPLIAGRDVVGMLTLEHTQPAAYAHDIAELAMAVGAQTAVAIQNARLFDQNQQALTESETLYNASADLNVAITYQQILEVLQRHTIGGEGAIGMGLCLFDRPWMEEIEPERIQVMAFLPAAGNETLVGQTFGASSLPEARELLLDKLVVLDDVGNLSPQGEVVPIFRDLPASNSVVFISLVVGGQWIGFIHINYPQRRQFSEAATRRLMALSTQAAVAVQNLRSIEVAQQRAEEAQARAEETAALNDLARALSSQLGIEQVLDEVYRGVSRLLDATNFYIALYDPASNENVFRINVTESQVDKAISRLPADQGITGYILRTQESILLTEGVQEWMQAHGIPQVGESAKSWLGVPLLLGDRPLGVMAVQDYRSDHAFSPRDLALLQAIASQASIAIQNANLFEANQAALTETETLYRAVAALSTAQTYADILQVLRQYTIAGVNSNLVGITYFDRPWSAAHPPEWIQTLARWTTLSGEIPDRYPYQAFPSIVLLREALERKEMVVVIEDFATDPRLDETARRLYEDRFHAASALLVPMVVGGQWVGLFNITYESPSHFAEGDVRRLTALAGQAAVAVQNLHSIELAQQRAQEAQQRSEELDLINRIVSSLVTTSDLRVALDTVAATLMDEFDLGGVGIALLNPDRASLTIVADKTKLDRPLEVGTTVPVKGNPATEQVITTRRPVVIENVLEDERLAAAREVMRRRGNHAIAIFPIISSGEVIGTLGLDITATERKLSPSELTLLETIVAQISTAIENSRLFEQTQQALAETENLYQASSQLNGVKTYDGILSVLRQSTVLGHANAVDVSVYLFDRPWVADNRPEWMNTIARWPANPYQQTNVVRVSLASWPTADLLLNATTPTYVENAVSDLRLDPTAQALYVNQLGAKTLLFVPLSVGGQWVGQIVAAYSAVTFMGERELREVSTLAGQAAVAIQNIRLLEESRRRAAQLETAAEIARDTSGTLALDILLKRAVNLLRERYGYYHASIFLLDESGLNAVIRESTGEAGEEMKRRGHRLAVGSQSVIGYVTQSGAPLVINNVAQNPTHRPNPLLPDTKAELGIPLKIGYRVMGALDVQSNQVDAFSPDDVSVLQTLADQIAVAVDNARSYEMAQMAVAESRKRVQELSVLYNVSQSLSSAPLESVEIANIISRQFIEIMDMSKCSIYVMDAEANDLRSIADLVRRDETGSVEVYATEDVGTFLLLNAHPAAGRVMNTLQPLLIQAADPFADPVELAYMKENGIETMVILPLAAKGQAVGLVVLQSLGRALSYSTDQINLAMTLGNAAAQALDNARLYEEQRRATEKLREVDKLKSQFLANMSHELRTPLNSIIGFSRVILKGIDGPITELQQQDLAAINSAGQHLLNLINDILDISKIEAGKMELAIEENVNLNDMINSAMSYAVGLTKDKPIKLVKNVPADLPQVRADPTKLRQVVINFLSNASKFTEEGSITVSARTQTGPEGFPEVRIDVTDTGPGISPEDQKKLFQPFTQVDGSLTRKVGGTGLGLSISRRLIEMHGGRVELDSKVGVGSTFSIILPLPYEALRKAADMADKKVILSIDDDRQVISLYERYLSGHGYHIVPLTEPGLAVEQAKQIKPFAITLDIMMPNRNGWQVLEALKADPETHDIPVIICSIVDEQDRGFSLGAADYLTKPILEDDLVRTLGRLNHDGSIREVLVIDDDADDLRLVEKILRENGQYEVRLANGGPEGLAAIHTKPPDAIILDLMMPELDGFTLLETIRSEPALRDIPVIIFTAGDLTEEQLLHLAEHSQQMIRKSAFKEEDLLKSIEQALDRFKTED